ncbi:MAG: hypothetical protein J0M17_02070 [Planctomycetes bacterium]|nr:hypothetical protein [Planctomycetota bacterium]
MASSASRWETFRLQRQFDAELRTNVVRIAAVGLLYTLHLLHHFSAGGKFAWLDFQGFNFLGLDDGAAVPEKTHLALTFIALAWATVAMIIHLALASRIFPPGLMYASTLADVGFLTAVLVFTSGAASPLVAVYLLIIAMAGLRLQLSLVRCATLAAMFGYLTVLGCRTLGVAGDLAARTPAVPRYYQLMFLATLAIAGIVAGQSIRHVRRLVDGPLADGPETSEEAPQP